MALPLQPQSLIPDLVIASPGHRAIRETGRGLPQPRVLLPSTLANLGELVDYALLRRREVGREVAAPMRSYKDSNLILRLN